MLVLIDLEGGWSRVHYDISSGPAGPGRCPPGAKLRNNPASAAQFASEVSELRSCWFDGRCQLSSPPIM